MVLFKNLWFPILVVVAGMLVYRSLDWKTIRPIVRPLGQEHERGYRLIAPGTVKSFERADKKNLLNIKIIGKSSQGRPLYLFKLTRSTSDRKLFVVCRQHGYEPGATIAFVQTLDGILSGEDRADYLKRVAVYVVPEANPDGAAAYTREDSKGNDLNRQWHKPSAPEVITIKRAIADLQPDLVLDMHDYGGGSSFVEAYQDDSRASRSARLVARKISEQVKLRYDPACRVAYSSSRNHPGLLHRAVLRQLKIPAILVESRQSDPESSPEAGIGGHRSALQTAIKHLASQ